MIPPPSLLLLAALIGPPTGALQEPDPLGVRRDQEEEDGESLSPLERLRRDIQDQVTEGVLGAWEMTSFVQDGVPAPADELEGYVVFGEEIALLVMHGIGFDEVNLEETPIAQGLMFRYRVDEFGALQTSTVMGHSNPFGDMELEPGGVLREYFVDYADPTLSLRHSSGTTIQFLRLPDPEQSLGLIERLARGLDSRGPFDRDEPRPTEQDPGAETRAGVGAEDESEAEAAESEDDEEQKALDPFVGYRLERLEVLEQGIEGNWRLDSYSREGIEYPRDEVRARLVVTDGLLGLVIHAIGFDPVNGEETVLAQAGIFSYTLDQFGTLETTTIVAHDNSLGEVEWELGGEIREYFVEYSPAEPGPFGFDEEGGEILVLRHASETTMRFSRVRGGGLTEREISRLDEIRRRGFDPRADQDAAVDGE